MFSIGITYITLSISLSGHVKLLYYLIKKNSSFFIYVGLQIREDQAQVFLVHHVNVLVLPKYSNCMEHFVTDKYLMFKGTHYPGKKHTQA